ncbi:MAG: ribosome maturation factor RimM [Muribaculaceae bacterium]|nr:ribosome maturation factor RimM [Muribaculaceae bacterium]
MIRDSILTLAGRFNKPHGVNGEISATLMYDTLDLKALRCIVVNVDGINVPFFLRDVRPKGRESVLVSIDGFDSDEAVGAMANKDFYALTEDLKGALSEEEAAEAEEDGLYAADLKGYTMLDLEGEAIGEITGIEDSTANVLFVVMRADGGGELLVPVADDFISEVDTEARTITMDLPEGIIGL